jgi:hypothetical protein
MECGKYASDTKIANATDGTLIDTPRVGREWGHKHYGEREEQQRHNE